MAAQRKPTPKHVSTVCDVCGLAWARHGKDPTLETCVRLLTADLTTEKRRTAPLPAIFPPSYPGSGIPFSPKPYVGGQSTGLGYRYTSNATGNYTG